MWHLVPLDLIDLMSLYPDLLHFPTLLWFNSCQGFARVERGRKKKMFGGRSVTQAYSGRALESSSVPVNARSFGQADRKEKRAAGYKRDKRGGGESSQTGREQSFEIIEG